MRVQAGVLATGLGVRGRVGRAGRPPSTTTGSMPWEVTPSTPDHRRLTVTRAAARSDSGLDGRLQLPGFGALTFQNASIRRGHAHDGW
jgi:hypothetical protein